MEVKEIDSSFNRGWQCSFFLDYLGYLKLLGGCKGSGYGFSNKVMYELV